MKTIEQAANDYTSEIHDPNMGKGLKIKNAFIAGAEFMKDKYDFCNCCGAKNTPE